MSRTALYRHFDSVGRLLYVGISYSFGKRLSEHARVSHWSDSIARADVEWFPTRAAALTAERDAIKCERPLYNKTHNGPLKPGTVAPLVKLAKPTACPTVYESRTGIDPNEDLDEWEGPTFLQFEKLTTIQRDVMFHDMLGIGATRILFGEITVERLLSGVRAGLYPPPFVYEEVSTDDNTGEEEERLFIRWYTHDIVECIKAGKENREPDYEAARERAEEKRRLEAKQRCAIDSTVGA